MKATDALCAIICFVTVFYLILGLATTVDRQAAQIQTLREQVSELQKAAK